MTEQSGMVFDIKRFAIHDGPGIRTTVFMKACPLSCFWCHNSESQRPGPELLFWADRCTGCGLCAKVCPAEAISIDDATAVTDRSRCTACGACVVACPTGARAIAGERWTVDRILDVVERDTLFYDESGGGVTLSGGEPLAQPEFAVAILAGARKRRIHTAVDTSGFADWSDLERVGRQTDLFLYDVKHLEDDRHRELAGVSNAGILENLRRLSDSGHSVWIRYPMIPNVNDDEGAIIALGRLVSGLRSVEAVHLLPFHRGGERKLRGLGRRPLAVTEKEDPKARAEALAKILRRIVAVDVRVGG